MIATVAPKFNFAFPTDDLGPELEARIDELAPDTPPFCQTDEQKERWAWSARCAAMIGMHEGEGESDSEIAQYAWHVARTFYNDPETYPMPTSEEAAALRAGIKPDGVEA